MTGFFEYRNAGTHEIEMVNLTSIIKIKFSQVAKLAYPSMILTLVTGERISVEDTKERQDVSRFREMMEGE